MLRLLIYLSEMANLEKVRKPYDEKVKEYNSLETWSDGIVQACKWLEATIEGLEIYI